MGTIDLVSVIFGALIARLSKARTLEHPEVAGLCRALALATHPDTGTGTDSLDETDDMTNTLRSICRRVHDDIVGGIADDYGLFARDLFVRHAENANLGTIFSRFADRPGS